MPIDLKAFLISYTVIELCGLGLFPILRRYFQPSGSFSWFSVGKGAFERLVLLTGMTMGMTSVLILFGALKIGTRISQKDAEQESQQVSNDYFLVGNLLSVLLTLIGVGIYSYLTGG
jgi:uncharacterized membrane protein